MQRITKWESQQHPDRFTTLEIKLYPLLMDTVQCKCIFHLFGKLCFQLTTVVSGKPRIYGLVTLQGSIRIERSLPTRKNIEINDCGFMSVRQIDPWVHALSLTAILLSHSLDSLRFAMYVHFLIGANLSRVLTRSSSDFPVV